MKIEHLSKFILVSSIVAAAALIAAAQDGVQERSIQSNDSLLLKQRQASTNTVRIAPRVYKYVRSDKNPVRHVPPKRPIARPTALRPTITEIGITMWRLRPPKDSEKKLLLLAVEGDKGQHNMWLPERVDTDEVFRLGDHVRFAVESSTTGYLYVIDRETLANGAFGKPRRIFPTSDDENNLVRPGMLFDFPDRNDDSPSFKIEAVNPNYTGELMTIIISPKPLTGIKADKDGYVTNADLLTGLEFGSEVEIFSRKDTADKFYSKPESKGSCGIATRELIQKKSSVSPCGPDLRPLTSDDPQPQSIYRVLGTSGQPAVAFIKLSVRK